MYFSYVGVIKLCYLATYDETNATKTKQFIQVNRMQCTSETTAIVNSIQGMHNLRVCRYMRLSA